MSAITNHESRLIGLHSEWIEKSQMRIQTRKLEDTNKIVVEVWELTYGKTSKARSLSCARKAARNHPIVSVDCVQLTDVEIDKKVSDLTGQQHRLRIRQSAYVFSLV